MDKLRSGRWLKYEADYSRQRYCCADNVTANSGSGGATFAADDIGGVHFPRTKLVHGADGTNDGDVSSANPLPVTLASVPSHAVTNAGTFAVQASSVVPGTAATNLGKAEDAAHASGDVGVMAMSVRQDTAAALGGTDADYQPLITDGSGRLHVNVGNTVTVGSHAVTNAGTFAVQVDGNALTALQLIDDTVFTDDAAFTPGTSKVLAVGFQADESSTDSVDEGDAGAARMTLDRKVITNPQPHTAGGLTTARSLDLDETEEEIKASAGQVYGWNITNFRTSTVYVKFYNDTAANVVVGTTTPLFTLAIPGASDDTMLSMMGTHGIAFSAAITWAATTGLADNDTGAPAANDVAGTVWYK